MEFKFVQIKANTLPQGGDNSKIIKIYGEYLKIFYLSITGPVSTKPGKKHPWVKEIQIFFENKEPCPSTRGVTSNS